MHFGEFCTFTVGYGDVLLKTQLGRILPLYMIIGIGVIGVITLQ